MTPTEIARMIAGAWAVILIITLIAEMRRGVRRWLKSKKRSKP